MSAKKRLTYTVRCWCEESGDTGEYEFKAPSRVEAINMAAEGFIESCAMAGCFYVPPRHRVQTEVIGIRA